MSNNTLSQPASPGVPDAQTQEAYFKFVGEFAKESDRAAVIVGAAKLDNLLYQLIQAALLAAPSSQDELLDGDAPLGTFSSRINMAYRLGLVDNELSRALHIIRRIRNSLAHELSPGQLNGGAHADRIRELATPFKTRVGEDYERFCKIPGLKGSSGASLDFRASLSIVGARLETALVKAKPLHSVTPVPLVPPSWLRSPATDDEP